MSNMSPLTAQERLALSRKAILNHMNRHHASDERELGFGDTGDLMGSKRPRQPTNAVVQAFRIWWHRHPASTAVELVRPLLSDYAASHPYKLLGTAAALGALAVVARPWRMVSISGLMLAAAKSSGMSAMLLSLLTERTASFQNNQNNQEAP